MMSFKEVRFVWLLLPITFGVFVFFDVNRPSAQPPKSILDIDEEEEEPISKPPKKSTKPKASETIPLDFEEAEEEERVDSVAEPKVETGAGVLDDLLDDSDDEAMELKAEPVCDIVVCSGRKSGETRGWNVLLLKQFIRPPFAASTRYQFDVVSKKGKKSLDIDPFGRQIREIKYYEQRMLQRAADELGLETTMLANTFNVDALMTSAWPIVLSDSKKRAAASRATTLLQTAINEHDSAVERRLRQDEAFRVRFRDSLTDALFNVEISLVRALYADKKYDQALAGCDRLMKDSSRTRQQSESVKRLMEPILLEPARAAFRNENYAFAREQLDEFVERFPVDPGETAEKLRDEMIELAGMYVRRAEEEKNTDLIDQAADIWPRFRGLDETRRRMQTEYPLLRCAYASLPRRFSPLSVRTPADRHAVALMFESLVQWQHDDRVGPHYEPQLAQRRSYSISRGREFFLPKSTWSDSGVKTPEYCTASDVVRTIELLKKVNPFGFSSAWESLIEDVDTTRHNDPFRFAITLKRDHWQPLSMMDFKIVPAHRFPKGGDDEALAAQIQSLEKTPVGTGPYMLAKPNGTTSTRFVANPYYRKAGLPRIREIAFEERDSVAAVDLFRNGKIHLIYGVRPEHVVQLRTLSKRVETLRGRGVYFLAPNYRRKEFQNQDLRLAIAHAIDRTKILDTYFRPAGAKGDHAELSGPFPKYTTGRNKRSWAYNNEVPGFSTERAKSYLQNARAKLPGGIGQLSLAFPSRNQETEEACQEIKRQLDAIGVTIELDAQEPDEFRDNILNGHNFDLAYWRHDFEDETYWIWPLFDPADMQAGGANFMGYVPDPDLRGLFDELKIRKRFRTIQKLTHDIHEYFTRTAVIIPLWQLDEYVAVSRNVENVQLDPISLFQNVENWRLKPQ